MGASIDLASLRERVRDALDMYRVATFDGLQLRKSGAETWTGPCPFHAEKTGSFVVGGSGWKRGRYHCFGCGADGDIFDYWVQRRGVDHLEAVKQLAGLGGVYVGEISFEKPKAGVARQPEKRLVSEEERAKKPSLPSLWQAKEEDCRIIAEGRGLPYESVWIAARVHKRVAVVQSWPMREWRGRWMAKDGWEQHRCWTIIDETKNVAEFRRLDNGRHMRKNGEVGPKTWSTAGKSWPVGAAAIRDRRRVLLVEGGPDMLAAYHFLRMWHTPRRPLLHDVAVVCMLGASNRIREDALPFFKGCRVRMMVDADTPKDDEVKAKRKLTGLEAAKRWSDQLTEAGAAVECFYVGDIFEPFHLATWHNGEIKAAEIGIIEPGFVKPDGSKVKDLNDLALCGEDVTKCDDVREAFTVWDF
jgi:hypothetical protein